jgi:hypothetical protein
MKTTRPTNDAALTEITIQPDGRVYVQGLSRDVLEILGTLQPDDPRLNRLLEHVRDLGKPAADGAAP